MSGKRITIINGHPGQDRLCTGLFDAYVEGAQAAGAELRSFHLRDIEFDPVLHEGYVKRQDWEPGLAEIAEAIQWCEHLTFVFPMWWGQMPALMKGFVDRVLLPGVAFKYHEGDPFWDRLLKGRSGDVLVTMDTPAWYLRLVYGNPLPRMMKGQVMGFCGIKPARIHKFGPIRGHAEKKAGQWMARARKAGASAVRLKAK